jgi:CheY-like chemotaxis protein
VGHHRLLLADDSVTIQRVIELTFSGENVQVIAVGDGEQAIARIQSDRPDIVLADIGMPKRSGYDVAAFVKSHADLKHIPVLLLAGAFEPVDNAKAEQVGCDGVLVKPFEPQAVIARVRELLDGVKGSGPIPTAKIVPEPKAPSLSEPRAESSTHAPVPEPAARAPEPVDDPLDDYFERLDAAFSTRNGGPAVDVALPDDDRRLPTLDTVLAQPSPMEMPAVAPPVTLAQPASTDVVSGFSPTEAPPTGRTVIADAFSALLSLEAGDPGARAVRLTTAPEQPVVTDTLIEEVTRRVLQRLAPDAARDVVVEVVSEVAERLVRDEIARIRGK